MKKTLLTMTVALVTSITTLSAQNVNIPDANFKAYLLADPAINTNMDTEIQVSEANVFTGTLLCNGLGIADLTGIEEFLVLSELKCYNNSLTGLDLSTNTALTVLDCSNNSLTNLNVSANTGLTSLSCGFNSLKSLDISNNTMLKELGCNFNSLSSLNVSTNTALVELNCSYNSISSLNVSTNTSLATLACYQNSITTLNVSTNTDLESLLCYNNSISSLDVSGNPLLLILNCSNNTLTNLNLKNANNSNFVASQFSASNNPNLFCIQVDNAAYSTTNWTDIDATASFSESCGFNTGIDNHLIENAISVYPNPTKNQINFSIQTNAQLISESGQIIADRKNVTTLNLSDQPTGVYLLTLTNNKGQIIQQTKIVKE
jgi:Leucine-rich repeat (LRR) protein